MNNLVIFVIAGAFLCGAAVGNKAGDFQPCKTAGDCRNNCCVGSKYCAPLVNGTCSQQLLEQVCKNPQGDLAQVVCPIVNEIVGLIPEIFGAGSNKGLLQQLLGAVNGLLRDVLRLTGTLPLVESLVNGLLRDIDGNLNKFLDGLNSLIADLLKALLG